MVIHENERSFSFPVSQYLSRLFALANGDIAARRTPLPAIGIEPEEAKAIANI